jgi:hypothetical protein
MPSSRDNSNYALSHVGFPLHLAAQLDYGTRATMPGASQACRYNDMPQRPGSNLKMALLRTTDIIPSVLKVTEKAFHKQAPARRTHAQHLHRHAHARMPARIRTSAHTCTTPPPSIVYDFKCTQFPSKSQMIPTNASACKENLPRPHGVFLHNPAVHRMFQESH